MDRQQLTEQIAALNLILGKISRYQKQNQYAYLRPFESWRTGYNQIAERLMTAEVLSVPLFKLKERDYSASGKSIRLETVEKLVKTIHQQIFRLEEKIEERNRAAENKLAVPHPFEKFFQRDESGVPVVPALEDERVCLALPAAESSDQLFQLGIQPVLESLGLSAFRADRTLLDDDIALGEFCRQLYVCRMVIVDLSGLDSQVMLILGMACGIGKPVIVLQSQHEQRPGAMIGSSKLPYVDADDIRDALGALLFPLLKAEL